MRQVVLGVDVRCASASRFVTGKVNRYPVLMVAMALVPRTARRQLHAQRRFDHHLRPRAVEQVIFGDPGARRDDQRGQQVEGARAQRDRNANFEQFLVELCSNAPKR
jgi:hypothetical protein